MIPKKIHYCWFGGKPFPNEVQKCIDSWKAFCPDYEIIEWNENNYSIEDCCSYVREAYSSQKWAFVSDYVRFDILYKYGGVYFDTDVELIKSIDDILEKGSFMGCEKTNGFSVNPGLGIAAEAGNGLYKRVLDRYGDRHFIQNDGSFDQLTVVEFVTDILKDKGLSNSDNIIQNVEGITIYPKEYFCPMNYRTGELKITNNTRSIHHYTASWHTKREKRYHHFGQVIGKRFGEKTGRIAEKIISAPYHFVMRTKSTGFLNTVKHIFAKLKR